MHFHLREARAARARVARRVLMAFLLAAACSVTAQAQTSTDETTVMQFYPVRLTQGIDPADLVKTARWARADLDGSGHTDYIVAAYFNSLTDAVRVLRAPSGAAAAVAYEPDLPALAGAPVTVHALDLDGDKVDEIVLSQVGERSTADWLFRWNGTALADITPMQTVGGRAVSKLTTTEPYDLDDDGRPELLAREKTDAGPVTHVFRVAGGVCTQATDIYLHDRFSRTTATDTDVYEYEFVVPAGNYTLHVVNGKSDGTKQVTAGEIAVNDVTVVAPAVFAVHDRFVDVPVTLNEANDLWIEVGGVAGSELTVTLTRNP